MIKNRKILILGSNPSNKNANKHIPFVGTRSYSILISWLNVVGLSVDDILLINLIDEVKDILNIKDLKIGSERVFNIVNSNNFTHVVALGKNASKVCKMLNLYHFPMPHPSGLNRQLNDKKFISDKLQQLKNFLNQEDFICQN